MSDITVKQRDVSFCNIKLLLIFFVVLGHMIEAKVDESEVLLVMYKLIYSVHMPLFVFLSGYFLRSREGCLRQAMKSLKLYVVLQLIVYTVVNYIGVRLYAGVTEISVVTPAIPFWHFWYLLSLAGWCMVGYCFLELEGRYRVFGHKGIKMLIIICAMAVAIVAGCDGKIGRELSMSRTIVFLPYFLAGLYVPKDIQWHRYKGVGIVALTAGVMLFAIRYDKINYSFLWQAGGYGGNITEGMINRLVSYVVAAALGTAILTLIPYKRFALSKIGADTLKIYICHGFVLMAVNRVVEMNITLFVVMAPLISILIIYLIYKVFKWSGQMYSLPAVSFEEKLCERK